MSVTNSTVIKWKDVEGTWFKLKGYAIQDVCIYFIKNNKIQITNFQWVFSVYNYNYCLVITRYGLWYVSLSDWLFRESQLHVVAMPIRSIYDNIINN